MARTADDAGQENLVTEVSAQERDAISRAFVRQQGTALITENMIGDFSHQAEFLTAVGLSDWVIGMAKGSREGTTDIVLKVPAEHADAVRVLLGQRPKGNFTPPIELL